MSTRRAERNDLESSHAAPARVITTEFGTPWGEGLVSVTAGQLVEVELPPLMRRSEVPCVEQGSLDDQEALVRWVAELESYFRGEKLSWAPTDVAAHLSGLSLFARRTVEALMSVPEGATVSYGALAAMAGYPRAARAVGSVMAGNPLPVVIPCHRVILSDGSLGRYGTDASWKERLLSHEQRSRGCG